MLNVVAIMGRLVADPELRTTPAGVNVCQFRIACDRNFARQGEQRQADFVDIVAWRAQADFVCKYFSKGTSSAKVNDGGEATPRSEAWPKADPPANYSGVDDFAVIDDNDDLPF